MYLEQEEVFDLMNEAKSSVCQFVLSPKIWEQRISINQPLVWNTYLFEENLGEQIPKNPGIYAFLVKPKQSEPLEASFPFYIGETTSLYRRLSEYKELSFGEKRHRDNITYMLKKYSGHIYFSFAVLESIISKEELINLEGQFLLIFKPPFNRKFNGEVTKIFSLIT